MFRTPHLNPLEWLAAVALIVGGLNWGLVGIFEFDLVAWITGNEFGEVSTVSRIIYILVGLSALYMLPALLRMEAMTARVERERSGGGTPVTR